MTERPQNLRTARHTDRTHNSHRHQPAARTDEGTGARGYWGAHRDDHARAAAAQHRSSRQGRHHETPDHTINRR